MCGPTYRNEGLSRGRGQGLYASKTWKWNEKTDRLHFLSLSSVPPSTTHSCPGVARFKRKQERPVGWCSFFVPLTLERDKEAPDPLPPFIFLKKMRVCPLPWGQPSIPGADKEEENICTGL